MNLSKRKIETERCILNNILILFSFFVASYLYMYVFLKGGYSTIASDRFFHIERFEEAYRNLKTGHVFSMISTFSSLRVGQAIGTYYPSGNLIVYAIIRSIIHKPVTSIFIFFMIGRFIGFVVSYYSCKCVTKRKDISYVFSILYTLCPYMMFNDYARYDVGESWASIFIPMAFSGLYIVLFRKERFKGSLLLGLGMALITYSHILSTVFAIIILMIIYVTTLNIQNDRINSFKFLAVSVFIYIISTAGFIIPFIKSMLTNEVQNPQTEFFNTSIEMSRLVSESLKNGIDIPNVGFILIIAALIGLFSLYKRDKRDIFERYIYVCGVLLLIFSTSLFPWGEMSNTAASIIQFPWRILTFAIMFLSLYASMVICNADFKALKYIVILLTVLFSVSAISQRRDNSLVKSKEDPAPSELWFMKLNNDNYSTAISINRDTDSAVMVRDYLPKRSIPKANDIYNHNAYVNGKRYGVRKKDIKSGYQEETFILNDVTSKNGDIILPFVVYDVSNYKLTVNGRNEKLKVDKYSRVKIEKTRGIRNVNVKIKYITPKYIVISRYISFISIIVIFVILLAIEWVSFYRRIISLDD